MSVTLMPLRQRQRGTRLALLLPLLLLGACKSTPPEGYQGYLEADYAYIGAPVAGRLTELPLGRGESVTRGASLFTLDGELERQQLLEVQGRLNQAQAQRADLSQGRRPDEIRVIAERVRQARSALDLAERELKRTGDLQKRGLASNDALDRANSNRTQAQASLASTLAEQRSAELAGRPDLIAAADAAVVAAEAQVGQAQWRVDQTQIRALQDGRVEDTLYQLGEWVPTGAPVLKLLPASGPFVRFFVPMKELAQWSPGQSVAISCSGCSVDLDATVSFIAASPEYTPPVIFSESRSEDLVYRVEARFDAPAPLAPGLPVTVVKR
jgi:HlyD family secretion protein